jgi:hypothetical protein
MISYKNLKTLISELFDADEGTYSKPKEEDIVQQRKHNNKRFSDAQKVTITGFKGATKGMDYIGHEKHTDHAIMRDDDGNYIRIHPDGSSLVHFKD